MPTYEFSCPKKHPKINVIMRMTDTDVKVHCPECNAKMKKLVSKFTGYVKGKGWANTPENKSAMRRDMHKHHLIHNDPYKSMRQGGEIDDMLDRFKKAGSNPGPSGLCKGDEELFYKVCTKCKLTKLHTLFECGTKNRCVDCTPENERVEPKKKSGVTSEDDKEIMKRILLRKQSQDAEFLADQKRRFQEEFGIDVDNVNEEDNNGI